MKFKFRIPSLKKRISSRMSLKKIVRDKSGIKKPKGTRALTNPRKAIRDKIYKKTTIGISTGSSKKRSSKKKTQKNSDGQMDNYTRDIIEEKSIERELDSGGKVICDKCNSDSWAVVERRVIFKKYKIMYCEVCGSQQGLTYEGFVEIVNSKD